MPNNDPFAVSTHNRTSPTPKNPLSPVVYILLGLLCWGVWTQREEVSRLRSELRQISHESRGRLAAQNYQETYQSALDQLRVRESEKEALLIQSLSHLSAYDVEELKQLHYEKAESQELIDFVTSREGSHKKISVTPEWLRELVCEDAFQRVIEVILRIKSPESDLQKLSEFPTIRSLSIGHSRITPESIAHLKKLPHLESLHLGMTKLDDPGLVAICELKSLEKLTIHGSEVTDAGLMKLGQLRRLKELRIDWSKAITDQGLNSLAGLTELRTLDLHGAKINGSGFANLTSLPLEKLWLHGTLLDNEGLSQVAKMTSLKYLRFDESKVDDAGLKHLKQLPNLRSVRTGRGTSEAANRILRDVLPKVHIER